MVLNRDDDSPQDEISNFQDSRVCRNYLAGLCLSDLFPNTKMDMGECMQAQVPELKSANKAAQKTRDYGYKYDLEKQLFRYHSEVTRKITKAQKRLKEENDGTPIIIDLENSTLVLELTAKIMEELEKAEAQGLAGEVDLSHAAMNQVEEFSKLRSSAKASALLGRGKEIPLNGMTLSSASQVKYITNQKLRVCSMCGAFLSIFNIDRRLADHFGGKLHLGYLQI